MEASSSSGDGKWDMPPLPPLPYWHRTAPKMRRELYMAAKDGKIDFIKNEVDLDMEHRSLAFQISPKLNTILHIAASSGHDQLVGAILKSPYEFAVRKNYAGDLALHVATSAGHLPIVEKLASAESLQVKNNEGNTPLHLALINKYRDIANFLVEKDPEVSYYLNEENKSPLYMAAEAGDAVLVQLMIERASRSEPFEESKSIVDAAITEKASRSEPFEESKSIVDAAITEKASRSEPFEESKSIVDAAITGKASRSEPFEESKSIVDAAITEKASRSEPFEESKSIVHAAITEKASRSEPFEESKSIVHAAITGKNMDVLESVLSKHPNLIKERDNEGMSPLSYAASIGYLDGVRYLLTKLTDYKYERDRNGFFPIHTASSKGHIEVIQEFVQQCPDSIELLNYQGQNILHVAAVSGKAKVVSSMLEMPELEMLINEKDGEGNTSLHLASKGCHPKAVSILTWDKRVDLNLLNNEGKTALDTALDTDDYSWEIPPFRRRLTWIALKHAGAPHAPPPSWYRGNQPDLMPWEGMPLEGYSPDIYKDRVNTLMLVATLVATITFAAGFTVPGGNNDSEPHKGMATFLLHHMFHIFIISNAIAMYSSVIVVVALIWAQLGDRDLIISSLKFTVPILELALTMVSLAFMTGSYLIVRDINWLAYLVLSIGSFFLLILTILFAPLCLPSSLPHPIFRYIVYYPFCLLIIVTRSRTRGKNRIIFAAGLPYPVQK